MKTLRKIEIKSNYILFIVEIKLSFKRTVFCFPMLILSTRTETITSLSNNLKHYLK